MTDTPSTFRVHRRSPGFTPLYHDVANDDGGGPGPGLSYRALGLLTFMLSRPPGWAFSRDRLCRGPGLGTEAQVARSAREGRESVAATLRELTAAGYYRTQRVQASTGKWSTLTEVTDTPGHWGDGA